MCVGDTQGHEKIVIENFYANVSMCFRVCVVFSAFQIKRGIKSERNRESVCLCVR